MYRYGVINFLIHNITLIRMCRSEEQKANSQSKIVIEQ